MSAGADLRLHDERVDSLRADLLAWFSAHGRDLPWRHTHDPYRILVSEVMAQQTQIARVERAYVAFLERFGTLAALAAAPTADVLEQWRGLGYNRRALNLQRTCRAVVDQHGGRLPDTLDALLALPGIGPYTARALLVFAFEHPVAAVDVNVGRVVQRALAGRALMPRERQTWADAFVAPAPWHTAQAVMELGARYCTARRRNCAECPIRDSCAWNRTRHGADGESYETIRAEVSPRGVGEAGAADPGARPVRAPAPRFTDTDRYHRGRLLDALRSGAVDTDHVAVAARTDDVERAVRLANALVSEGLAQWWQGTLTLPERAPAPERVMKGPA